MTGPTLQADRVTTRRAPGTDPAARHPAPGGAPDPAGWYWTRDAVGVAVAAVAALLVGVTSLRFWEWRPGTPLALTGDAPVVLMQVDEIVTQGWFWGNERVGFPLGQNASFFPELDVVHVLGVKALGVLGADPVSAGAVYFLLGWPLVAATTYLLARSERLRRGPSVVVAVLFAAAPYHAERFEHLWLASYWTVPLAAWVVLAVARGRGPLDPGAPTSRRRLTAQLACLVLVGMSGAYYAGFTVLLLLAATALRAGAGRPRSWWVGGAVSTAVVGAVAAVPLLAARVGMAGTVLTGPRPATRNPLESERYAGRLIDLLLPWEGHRVDVLADLTTIYQTAGRPVPETLALGVVGATGACALLLVGLRALATGRAVPPRLALWGALVVVSGLFYTAGGLGSVVALLATPQLRTWSRLSLVILLFGLLAVGHWLGRPRRAPVALLALAGVLTVGVLDQTNPGRAPDHAANRERVETVGTYTRDLADATDAAGCGVLQLPVMRFPEGELPVGYDANAQLLQHLGDRRLAWSHGGMSGTRAGDWPLAIAVEDPAALHRQLRAAGFCAVEVDTDGVALDDPAVVRLTAPLGEPVARSRDGRLVAWSLLGAPVGSAEDRARLLDPVIVSLNAGPLTVAGGSVSQDAGPSATLSVGNLSGTASGPVRVRLDLTELGGTAREVVVRTVTGEVLARADLPASGRGTLDLEVDAPPGHTRWVVEASGEPVRDAAGRSVSVRLSDLEVDGTDGRRVVSLHDQVRTGLVVP